MTNLKKKNSTELAPANEVNEMNEDNSFIEDQDYRGVVESGEVERIFDRYVSGYSMDMEDSLKEQTVQEADINNEKKESLKKQSSLLNIRQERPIFVPKPEVYEVIREVPKVEVEWIEKEVEVPQYQYVDKYEEIIQYQYVPKLVHKVEIVEVPKEVKKHVPRYEVKTIEQLVEVPSGEKISVPYVTQVPTEIVVSKFVDNNIPIVMRQTYTPEVTETNEVYYVDVKKYVPRLVKVPVLVPKFVNVPMKDTGVKDRREVPVEVDPELLKNFTIELNPHLTRLEEFNRMQVEKYQRLVELSQETASLNNLTPPTPLIHPTICMDDQNTSLNTIRGGNGMISEEYENTHMRSNNKQYDLYGTITTPRKVMNTNRLTSQKQSRIGSSIQSLSVTPRA